MIEWKFNPADYNPDRFQLISPGKYRVRIESAEETMSKTGKQMVKMTLKVSGYDSRVWHYVVFDDTNREAEARTNDRLGQLWDSFNMSFGEMNLSVWKGRVGAADIRNEEDNKGEQRAVVKRFLPRKDQDGLPTWQEHPTFAPASDMASIDEMPF